MWQYRHTDELYHYGVKGMKWRHRKAQLISEGADKARIRAEHQQYRQDKKSF